MGVLRQVIDQNVEQAHPRLQATDEPLIEPGDQSPQ